MHVNPGHRVLYARKPTSTWRTGNQMTLAAAHAARDAQLQVRRPGFGRGLNHDPGFNDKSGKVADIFSGGGYGDTAAAVTAQSSGPQVTADLQPPDGGSGSGGSPRWAGRAKSPLREWNLDKVGALQRAWRRQQPPPPSPPPAFPPGAEEAVQPPQWWPEFPAPLGYCIVEPPPAAVADVVDGPPPAEQDPAEQGPPAARGRQARRLNERGFGKVPLRGAGQLQGQPGQRRKGRVQQQPPPAASISAQLGTRSPPPVASADGRAALSSRRPPPPNVDPLTMRPAGIIIQPDSYDFLDHGFVEDWGGAWAAHRAPACRNRSSACRSAAQATAPACVLSCCRRRRRCFSAEEDELDRLRQRDHHWCAAAGVR